MMRKIALAAAVAVGISGVAGTAHGAFVLVDDFDFDGVSIGAVNGQNGWKADHESINIVADGFTGNGLQNGGQSNEAFKAIPAIAVGTTGTLFFQFSASDLAAGQSIGLADGTAETMTSYPAGSVFVNYRPQLALTGAGAFTARNATTATINSVTLEADTWYSVWMVVNNADENPTWEGYIQGGSITTQTKLAAGSTDTFTFRGEETEDADLTNFLFARGGGGSGDSLVIDNIYVDTAGENLSNPIPEPSVLAMSGLLGAGLLARRRRQ